VVIRSEEVAADTDISDKQKTVLIIKKSNKLRNKKVKTVRRTKEENKKKKKKNDATASSSSSSKIKSYLKSSVNLLKICINKDTIKFKNGLEPKIVSETVENLTGIYVVVVVVFELNFLFLTCII
jgi:hypothetical protein